MVRERVRWQNYYHQLLQSSLLRTGLQREKATSQAGEGSGGVRESQRMPSRIRKTGVPDSETSGFRVIGICYKTIYNYINNGSLKTWKLCRKTLIRKADIDALFSTSSERPVVVSEKKPISEFYTTQEILEKFGISNSGFYRILKTEKFPKQSIEVKACGAANT